MSKIKVKFIRDTTENEAAEGEGFKKGDKAELEKPSVDRWLRREACELA